MRTWKNAERTSNRRPSYYKRALKKHSKDATVHNDMGLCYHRRGMLNDANKALTTAVELEPHKKLYRDNLAAVLVDQGKTEDALAQLTKAHGEPVGNYNLAYLLVQKHDNAQALHHFQRAAQLDPTLTAAHHWIAQLSPGSAPVATRPVAMVAQRQPNPGYPPTADAPPQRSTTPYAPGSIGAATGLWRSLRTNIIRRRVRRCSGQPTYQQPPAQPQVMVR